MGILFVKNDEEYALHLQTGFRIVSDEKIIIAILQIIIRERTQLTHSGVEASKIQDEVYPRNIKIRAIHLQFFVKVSIYTL